MGHQEVILVPVRRYDYVGTRMTVLAIIIVAVAVALPIWFVDDARVTFGLFGFTCYFEDYPCQVAVRVYKSLDDSFLLITRVLMLSCLSAASMAVVISNCACTQMIKSQLMSVLLTLVSALLAIGALIYFFLCAFGYGTFPVYLYDANHKGGLGFSFYIAAVGAFGLLASSTFGTVNICCLR
ncbi:unnamed protein product [Bursaphelenchus xylophilus]|uniref:(pine wood nematode) hypothetical protein n=1 Tax=Bursaphelenchus xylophilus TaxID=6326 RepID=A0A1I7SUU8_BURXY|nr:unnamed protein product [Bursaphelenchus xylophilus]CAG9125865.1 unnamed protein product [Bursaphelenchus xylophilus]